jgi:hypothetical protein
MLGFGCLVQIAVVGRDIQRDTNRPYIELAHLRTHPVVADMR